MDPCLALQQPNLLLVKNSYPLLFLVQLSWLPVCLARDCGHDQVFVQVSCPPLWLAWSPSQFGIGDGTRYVGPVRGTLSQLCEAPHSPRQKAYNHQNTHCGTDHAAPSKVAADYAASNNVADHHLAALQYSPGRLAPM